MSIASARPVQTPTKPAVLVPASPLASAIPAEAASVSGPALQRQDSFGSAGNAARGRSADEVQADAWRMRRASRFKDRPEASEAASRSRLERAEQAAARSPAVLQLGSVSIDRLGPQLTPLNPAQQKALNASGNSSLAFPPGFGFKDWRSAETAREVTESAPVQGRDGQPLSFGDLSIFVSSGVNMAPSAAQIFRIAQHSGKVVLAFQNNQDPFKKRLREAYAIDGVAVPPELRGKIFVIGDPDNRHAMGHDQASDALLEQLGQMHQQKDLLGLDVLQSKATLFGHSQGGHTGLMTRDRLTRAGLPDTIGRFVAIGTGWRGKAHPAFDLQAKASLKLVQTLGPAPDMERMVESNVNPTQRQKDFPQETIDRHVDLSVAGIIGPPAKPSLKWEFPPRVEWQHNNIRPQLRMVGGLGGLLNAEELMNSALGGDFKSDGLIPTALSREAKNFVLLEKPYDHAGLFEDPAVIDEILKRLHP